MNSCLLRDGWVRRRMCAWMRAGMLALLLFAPGAWAEEPHDQIELAFTPFLPVRTMLQNYQPMRAYLEKRLHVPVTLITAPDYQTYNARMREHAYSFIVTVANSAYLAYADYGYVPMLRPSIATRPVLLLAKNSRLKNMKALRGATIAMPDPLAVVAMQGVQMLREAGLNPERDVTIKYMQNHSAAVNLVISGEAGAAIVSDRALLQMPNATRKAVRVLQTWDAGAVPGVVYLASPHVPQARVAQVNQAILEFVHDTREGRALMKDLGYGGLAPVTPEELKALAPYGAQLKAAMGAVP